jgi:RNA polymerase sigma factor (sigma-70 family)
MDATDEQLVARALATADQRAFAELIRRHQGRLRGWLQKLTRDAALADELAQIAVIRAWEKLGSFSGQGSFSGWIMRIGYHVLVDERRSHRRRLRMQVEFQAQPPEFEPLAGKQEASEVPDLPRLLAVLSEDERVAMILCHAFGCSHAEAAELSGMPIGTVKSHVRRGAEKIQKRFGIGKVGHEQS